MSEEMSEEEGEVNNTLSGGIVVWKNRTSSSKRRGTSSSLKLVNQDNTVRLPLFPKMGKGDIEKHWFTC
jgi:hypothetical protein